MKNYCAWSCLRFPTLTICSLLTRLDLKVDKDKFQVFASKVIPHPFLPSTLPSAPYTLHLTPDTLHPILYIIPYTPNTINLSPSTFLPPSSTLYSLPSMGPLPSPWGWRLAEGLSDPALGPQGEALGFGRGGEREAREREKSLRALCAPRAHTPGYIGGR